MLAICGLARADVWDDAVPVHRFWSGVHGAHFFTISETEKNNVIANIPGWDYEGAQWSAFAYNVSGTFPVYRFWSDLHLSHFFTINEEEKNFVVAHYPEWHYEGIAWFAFQEPYPDTQPIFRFWSGVFQSHFYTSSIAERNYVIDNYWEWVYEGIAWYAPIGQDSPIDGRQLELLEWVNEVRATGFDCGSEGVFGPAQPLAWNSALAAAAARHSKDMAEADFFDHVGTDGTTVGDRALDAGYDYYIVGENIAAGYDSAMEVLVAWLNSPGHCANIMHPLYEEYGSAVEENPASYYQIYWTQVFGVRP
jgi:hypothetical protein